MVLLSKPDQTPYKRCNHYSLRFLATRLQLPLTQTAVLPFSQPCGYRMYIPGLTFNNSTLCPNSEFMCFVWI